MLKDKSLVRILSFLTVLKFGRELRRIRERGEATGCERRVCQYCQSSLLRSAIKVALIQLRSVVCRITEFAIGQFNDAHCDGRLTRC